LVQENVPLPDAVVPVTVIVPVKPHDVPPATAVPNVTCPFAMIVPVPPDGSVSVKVPLLTVAITGPDTPGPEYVPTYVPLNAAKPPPALVITGDPVSANTGAAVNAPVGLKRSAIKEKLPVEAYNSSSPFTLLRAENCCGNVNAMYPFGGSVIAASCAGAPPVVCAATAMDSLEPVVFTIAIVVTNPFVLSNGTSIRLVLGAAKAVPS